MASDDSALLGSLVAIFIGVSLTVIGIGAAITPTKQTNWICVGGCSTVMPGASSIGILAIAGIGIVIVGIMSIINIITGRHKDS